jgi:hypothetical protein
MSIISDYEPLLTPRVDQNLVPAAFQGLMHTILELQQRRAEDEYRNRMLGETTRYHNLENAHNQAVAAESARSHQVDEAQKLRDFQAHFAMNLGDKATQGTPGYDDAYGGAAHIAGVPLPNAAAISAAQQQASSRAFDALTSGVTPQEQPSYERGKAVAMGLGPAAFAHPLDALRIANEIGNQGATRASNEQMNADRIAAKRQDDAATEARQARRDELAQQRLSDQNTRWVTQTVDARVNHALSEKPYQSAAQTNQTADEAIALLNPILSSKSPVEAAAAQRVAVSKIVTSLHGRNSSDQEYQRIMNVSLGTDWTNKVKYIMDGGKLDPQLISGLKNAVVQLRQVARERMRQQAAMIRSQIYGDPNLQRMSDPQTLQTIANNGVARLLPSVAQPLPPAPADEPSKEGQGSMQRQADQLRNQNPDEPHITNYLDGVE